MVACHQGITDSLPQFYLVGNVCWRDMQHFYSVQDFLQRLVMNLIILSNGFSKVLRLCESLVTVISDAVVVFYFRISELGTGSMQHDHDVVFLSTAATF
jgi:hypothetical protein